MFQICVHNKKKKRTNIIFLKHFLNAMIRNIKIHNIFDIIEISKYVEHTKCPHLFKCFL